MNDSMNENHEMNISDYHEISLVNLVLPDHYKKLINRINNLNSKIEGLSIQNIGDIVALDVHQFSEIKGVGKRYIETLIAFKNELPFLLSNQKQELNSVLVEDIFTLPNYTCNLETRVRQLALSPRYQKLIKRILAVIAHIETVQDVIDIDVTYFLKLPGVGILYAELLINLQNALLQITDKKFDLKKAIKQTQLPDKDTLSKFSVNYSFLTKIEVKQLKKIERYYQGRVDIRNINELLNLDTINLAKQGGFGVIFLTTINDLQEKIKNELATLPVNIEECGTKQKGLLISNTITHTDFNEIDNILIEDTEAYLWALDEFKMNIALSRWGFNQQYETIEEIGNRYSISKELIRHYERSINTNLTLNFRIPPNFLWATIREKMTDDLSALLPNLARCFATNKLFFEFVEICCQIKSGSIRDVMMPKITNKVLNPIFCVNPSPITKEIIINDLISNYGYSKAAAIHGIKQLEKINAIQISEHGISPKKLGKIEAVAHVLTYYPTGLPWKDIARIVNKNGYSSTLFDEERLTHGFNDSEYIYLCSKGTYRNLIFLDIGQFDIAEIMHHLLGYLSINGVRSLHLHDYYCLSKGSRSEIEYFTLRHFVREYGEEYGLYFNGKSGTDSVSIDSKVFLISQADVIIKLLNDSKVPLTKQEIAARLRSKSIKHAAFYIKNLMTEGKVVRVDKMVYTTPEKAFKDIDAKTIMQTIKNIMANSDVIIEADVFREYVNVELNLSYSKYIYAALVKTQIHELAWHHKGTLFSKTAIPYKNLIDICKKLCGVELSNSQNIQNIQKAIWLTDAVATAAIQQWKLQMNIIRQETI